MKEVININIGGLVFSIEAPAYKKLKKYLNEIEDHFKGNEAGTEITQDIESSIAEKFSAKKKSLNKAVTTKDVETVMAQLGRVEDFDDDEDEMTTPRATPAIHRLYRDTDNAIIGGVAAGIANYFGIDPVIPRLTFILFTFWGGLGLLAYLILWVVVPKANTAAQKLAAKGEPTNLENIKNYIEKKIQKVPSKSIFHKILKFPVIIIEFLAIFLKKIFPVIRTLVGLLLVGVSSVFIFAISTLVMVIFMGNFNVDIDPQAQTVLQEFMNNIGNFTPIILGAYAALILPALVVFFGGMSLVFKKKILSIWYFTTLMILWITALSYTVASVSSELPAINQLIETIEEQERLYMNAEFPSDEIILIETVIPEQ